MEKQIPVLIAENTWRFEETAMGSVVYFYLLVGTSRALLIDSGYGKTDVQGAINEITSLPLTVVNTHGHYDHVLGNCNLNAGGIYLSQEDFDVYKEHTTPKTLRSSLSLPCCMRGNFDKMKEEIESLCAGHTVPALPLPGNMSFDLGGRVVDIIPTPGHTMGCISLLDRKNKLLFSGDTFCRDGVLLIFPQSGTVQTFSETLDNIRSLVADGTVEEIYPSHKEVPVDLKVLEYYHTACKAVLDGTASPEEMKRGCVKIEGTFIRFLPKRVR